MRDGKLFHDPKHIAFQSDRPSCNNGELRRSRWHASWHNDSWQQMARTSHPRRGVRLRAASRERGLSSPAREERKRM